MSLLGLFQQLGPTLTAELALTKHFPHSATSGSMTEGVVKAFLSRHLPRRLLVTSGVVVGCDEQLSGQADVLVVDSNMTTRFLSSMEADVVPADGVVMRVEVTQTMSRKKFMEDFTRIVETRKIRGKHPRAHVTCRGWLVAMETDTDKIEKIVDWMRVALTDDTRNFAPSGLLIPGFAVLRYSNDQWSEDLGTGDKKTHIVVVEGESGRDFTTLVWLDEFIKESRRVLRARTTAQMERTRGVSRAEEDSNFDWWLSSILDYSDSVGNIIRDQTKLFSLAATP